MPWQRSLLTGKVSNAHHIMHARARRPCSGWMHSTRALFQLYRANNGTTASLSKASCNNKWLASSACTACTVIFSTTARFLWNERTAFTCAAREQHGCAPWLSAGIPCCKISTVDIVRRAAAAVPRLNGSLLLSLSLQDGSCATSKPFKACRNKRDKTFCFMPVMGAAGSSGTMSSRLECAGSVSHCTLDEWVWSPGCWNAVVILVGPLRGCEGMLAVPRGSREEREERRGSSGIGAMWP
jgi:hypothetical protein